MMYDALVLANAKTLLLVGGGTWDLTNFLTNTTGALKNWFGLATTLLGTVMIAVALWQIGSGLMSHGKKQTNWALSIILLIAGGAMAGTAGFKFFSDIAMGGQVTIDTLGKPTTPTSLMMLDYMRAWLGL